MNPPEDDGKTGLPGFRTWGRVYAFVVAVLAAWVALLTALTWLYA
jgi:hypothetical protein